MPELPEVETVVRDLRAVVVGRRITGATLTQPSIVRYPDPQTFVRRLRGVRLDAVERRGKYILVALSRGTERQRSGAAANGATAPHDELVVHLGMTGHLDVCDAAATPRPHTHLRCRLDDGRELRYADARRFGRLLLGPRELLVEHRAIPRLGVEPLGDEFTIAALDAVLKTTTRSVKAALLDQSRVAGLGNIYVDEACFLAGVRPTRRCTRLTAEERQRLHAAIRAVLNAAIENRGSTIDDYRDLWNAAGTYQERLLAYGRGGLPCLRCGTTMRRTVVAGRGTAFCPSCQR